MSEKLLSYGVIVSAVSGETSAILLVLKHFDAYMDGLSKRPVICRDGSVIYTIDEDIKRELEIELITKLPRFNV